MRALAIGRIRPGVKSHILLENLPSRSKKFPSDNRGLLSDRFLANDLTDRIWESAEWKEDLVGLRKHGLKLIETIETEINENNK